MLSLLLLLLVGATFAQESGDFDQENSDQLISAPNDEDEMFDESLDDTYDYEESDEKDLSLSPESDHMKPDFSETVAHEDCPDKGTCRIYHLFLSSRSFFSAQSVCRSKRGNLSSIHNSRTNTFLTRFVRRVSANTNLVWIGVWKRDTCSPYRNIDGSRMDYSKWCYGRRRTYGRWCTAMNVRSGRWRSVHCRTRLPYICTYRG